MNNQVNHWKSTEFWATTIAQLLSALALFGFITPNDSKTLEEASNKIVAAVFLFVSNAAIVIYYIRSRLHMHLSGEGRGTRGEAKPGLSGLPQIVDKLPLIAVLASLPLILAALAAPAKGEILPWRQHMKQLHQQLQNRLDQHQHAPTPAPAPQIHIIQLPPSNQQLPIQGSPQQSLPIQGSPLQPLPIQGSPLQQVPIQGVPQQQLPIGGGPLQPLPIQAQPQSGPAPQGQPQQPAAPPKQQLPIQQIPITPPAPSVGPQRLSIYMRSLYRASGEAP
jgi:hypothetical protein